MPETETAGYDQDYHLWFLSQARLARSRQAEALDLEHLAEELEDMGKRERRGVESNLIVLLQHLLKWQFQPEQRSNGWRGSIREHRRRLRKELADSPSLTQHVCEELEDCYLSARLLAADDSGLEEDIFPEKCPYSPEALLNENFWPK